MTPFFPKPSALADLITYRKRRNRGEIDLTSLVDVVFLLLIFFLVTSQFAQPTATLELPTGGPGARPDESAIRLEVTDDGRLMVEGKAINDESFEVELERVLAGRKIRSVRFYGDRRIDYGRFVDLLERARSVGIDDFSIVKTENQAGGNEEPKQQP